MSHCRAALVALVALGLVSSPLTARAQPAFQFGKNASGARARPLLVVLGKYRDRAFGATTAGVPRDASFYSKLLAGPGLPNVRDFFLESSGGSFTFLPIGVIGPLTYVDDPGTRQDESLVATWKAVPPAQGAAWTEGDLDAKQIEATIRGAGTLYNLTAFDANSDGTVDDKELTLVVVTAFGNGGKTRSGCGPLPQGKRYCGTVHFVDEAVDFATTAHALHQAFVGADLYSPWAGPVTTNVGATLMGGTIGGADQRWTTGLDAWNRVRAGWVRPRAVATTTGACLALDASDKGGASPRAERAPIAVYDPSRGDSEYFLLEYRRSVGYDNPPGGPRQGVLAWYVKNDANGEALNVPFDFFPAQNMPLASRPAGDDVLLSGPSGPTAVVWGPNHVLDATVRGTDQTGAANWVLAAGAGTLVSGGLTQFQTAAFGAPTYFTRAHGAVRLTRPDGTDTGTTLFVSDDVDGTVEVRLASGRAEGSPACLAATIPRVDQPTATLLAPACVDYPSTARVRIAFATPVVQPVTVSLAPTNAFVAAQPSVTVPAGAREATFELRATLGGVPTNPLVELRATVAYPASLRATARTVTLDGAMRLAPRGDANARCDARSALAGLGASLAAILSMSRPGPIPRLKNPPPLRTLAPPVKPSLPYSPSRVPSKPPK
mgnify:CR=1 FL=1